MRVLLAVTWAVVLFLSLVSSAQCEKRTTKAGRATPRKQVVAIKTTPYRGWEYLVEKLLRDGLPPDQVRGVYQSTRFPPFTFVPFAVAPKETSAMYGHFYKTENIQTAAAFARLHAPEFAKVEKKLDVPREYVTAILFVETKLGRHTGEQMIMYRLSRVASVRSPGNVEQNFKRLRATDPTVTYDAVAKRAMYLESTFYGEIKDLFEIARRNRVNPLSVRGSIAGAFGMPQFLPSAFIRFGLDGDGDGRVSLYNQVDAIWSVANFLSAFGFKSTSSIPEKRQAVWRYNHSDAYVDTVLDVAGGIRQELR